MRRGVSFHVAGGIIIRFKLLSVNHSLEGLINERMNCLKLAVPVPSLASTKLGSLPVGWYRVVPKNKPIKRG